MRIIHWIIWACVPFIAFGKPKVVVTTTMLTEQVARIAGDEFDVVGLMGPGSDPHLYRLTARDINTILTADLIIINGLRLEGKLGQTLDQATRRGKTVLAVGDRLPRERLLKAENFDNEYDPHIWGDVTLWGEVVPLIRDALVQLLPDQKELLEARSQQLIAELLSLNAEIRQLLIHIPQNSRVLITSHDAFGYFGRAYNFEVLGIQGVSTGSEAGLGDLAALSKLIRERGIKAIFSESSVSPALIERLSRDSGAVVGAELYSDSMGTPDETKRIGDQQFRTGTYRGMMLYNATAIAAGLTPE